MKYKHFKQALLFKVGSLLKFRKFCPIRPVRAKALCFVWSFKAFAPTGRQICVRNYPGRCPGLGASALSGRAASGAFGLQPVLEPHAKIQLIYI